MPAEYATVVTDVFSGFGANLLTAAPLLLGISLISFGVPLVFRWGKRLIG